MEFAEYMNNWVKSELLQARIMIGLGILLTVAIVTIWKSPTELLRGMLIPLFILLFILVGYGSYILYSRPAHAKQSIQNYTNNPTEGVELEKTKHINDNKAGKTLIKYVYPSLLLIAAIGLFLVSVPYYKGVLIGIAILALSAYIIDSGFVSRSDAFLKFLSKLG